MASAAERPDRLIGAGRSCYRIALRVYPHAFYRQYADELEADFDDAVEEQLARRGQVGVLAAWFAALRDLPLSLAREWLRTPWPPALIVAGTLACTLMAFGVLRTAGPLSRYRARVAANVPPPADSPELLALMALMVLVPIAGLIIIGGVVALTARYTRGPGRRA